MTNIWSRIKLSKFKMKNKKSRNKTFTLKTIGNRETELQQLILKRQKKKPLLKRFRVLKKKAVFPWVQQSKSLTF